MNFRNYLLITTILVCLIVAPLQAEAQVFSYLQNRYQATTNAVTSFFQSIFYSLSPPAEEVDQTEESPVISETINSTSTVIREVSTGITADYLEARLSVFRDSLSGLGNTIVVNNRRGGSVDLSNYVTFDDMARQMDVLFDPKPVEGTTGSFTGLVTFDSGIKVSGTTITNFAGDGLSVSNDALNLNINELTEEPGFTSGDFVAFYDVTAGALRKVDYDNLPSGTTVFTGLTDTPANYTGSGANIVRVNAGETELEFVDETSDFLSQYALLAGRSGGQTLIGGTASGNDLTLSSTSNATKGTIFFGSAGNSGYDEVNNRLGIGTTSPDYDIEINGTSNNTLWVESTSTAGTSLVISNTTASTGPYEFAVTGSANGYGSGHFLFWDQAASEANLILNSNGNIRVGHDSGFTATAASNLSVYGNAAIGSGYVDNSAPTNGLIVQGDVGIGTSSPNNRLSVEVDTTDITERVAGFFRNTNASSNQVRLQLSIEDDAATTGNSGMQLFHTTGTAGWANYEARPLSFWTGTSAGSASKRMTIDTDGNVGLGTNAPTEDLDISKNSLVSLRLDYNTTQVGNDEVVGDIQFWSHRNTSGASVERARIEGRTGSNTNNGDLVFLTRAGGGGPVEALRIDNSQQVGIGTGSTISAKLHTIATSEQLRLGYDASNYLSATVASTGSTTFDLTGTSPEFTFSDAVNTADLDLGDGAAGLVLTLGRNTNATNTGAGSINFQQKGGTAGYVWQDAAGDMRINTAAPTNANDTAGTVIGTQTSVRDTKQDIEEYLDTKDALQKITEVPLKTFRYIKEVEGLGEEHPLTKTYLGFIADEVDPLFMRGRSIDQVSVNGLLIASIQELNKEVEELKLRELGIEGTSFIDGVLSGIKRLVVTDEICINDTCINEDQLKALIEQSGVENNSSSSASSSDDTTYVKAGDTYSPSGDNTTQTEEETTTTETQEEPTVTEEESTETNTATMEESTVTEETDTTTVEEEPTIDTTVEEPAPEEESIVEEEPVLEEESSPTEEEAL